MLFEKLTAEYPDTVGWLYCEGTPINYPVVQSKDNLRYLRRLPDGRYNAAGSLFADYRCKEVAASGNYIIYGHNMKNGSMFGTLVRYKSQNYYDEHPTLYYLTPERTFRIELIAGFVTSPAGKCMTRNCQLSKSGSFAPGRVLKAEPYRRTEIHLLHCPLAAMSMRMHVMS